MKPGRRRFVAMISGLAIWLNSSLRAFAQTRTPRQTEGPYYPSGSMRGPDQDNDLVRIEGAVREAGGEIIHLRGKIFSADRSPAANARIEIWQVDANGRYLHTGDSNSRERVTPVSRALATPSQMPRVSSTSAPSNPCLTPDGRRTYTPRFFIRIEN